PLLPFLFQQWPEVKHTKIKQWLRFGAVNVNDHIITQHDYQLQAGDVISIRPQKAPPAGSQLPVGLRVAYEDEELLVIVKPVNLLTVATENEKDKTAFHIMTSYMRKRGSSSHDRLWIVHRLDRETSGLIVMAKSEKMKLWMQANWTRMEKRYLAVVEGTLPKVEDTLTGFIDESQPHRVFVSNQATSKTREAITHYRVLGESQARSFLEITLESGRRHQIRAQLASTGCPIVGDKKYGARTNPIKRIALHASYLKLLHPSDDRELFFESPLPEEIARLAPAVK
ncbi:MAG: RluA family pseudouridine synthase, partial [Abditibacteriaceae bacterium]